MEDYMFFWDSYKEASLYASISPESKDMFFSFLLINWEAAIYGVVSLDKIYDLAGFVGFWLRNFLIFCLWTACPFSMYISYI